MSNGLLEAVRVLDLGGAESDAVSRLFADLGADVLKIEPPGGSPARHALPSVAGASIPFALHNANKRSAVLDPDSAADRDRLIELVGAADIVVDGGNPAGAAAFGTSCAVLAEQFRQLVVLSVTDFGTIGPYASWRATDPVLYAMSTALSRTGPTSGTPVLPPTGVASATAAVQAAWAALAAYYHRLRCGTGEYIDLSRFEAVVQALDPPFGSEGQAAVGLKRSSELWRGRPRNQQIYPIFPCKDGYVRICLLSARQWRGMFGWLGEPAQFADPKFDSIAARYAASRELNAAISELCAAHAKDDLVADGQRRGVPIASVLTPAEALSSAHFRAVGALADVEIAAGADVSVPVGPFVVDGEHAGYARPGRSVGADEADWATRPSVAQPEGGTVGRPFDGMRILDLGVIVAGGELGRLFADLGAAVIKVESAAYPDGLRQTPPGQVMSRSWALTHRNEYGLGLDLRHPSGAALFERLVAGADAVFANFKPGTLASLGFSYERLRALNPRIVLAESSAFGATGPWSARMGYGPLVRATTGVTSLWTSEDAPRGSFYDAATVFPDHVSARITAIATLAAVIGRDRAGTGAHIHISQAEAAVNQLATAYVAEAARAARLPVTDDPAVHAVYPCDGDDEWCVISLRSDADRVALAAAMGRDALPGDRSKLIAAVSEWTSNRDKTAVAEQLQRAGVPAAQMNRAVDVLVDSQITFRKVFSEMTHPLFDAPMPAETGPAPYLHIAPAEFRPAPMPGEHTREICQKLLALDADETDRLIAEGVLFTQQGEAMMAGQPIDPRTPVLIGYGQVNQHDDHPGVEPVDLMVAAARAATDPRVLEAVDSVRVVNVLSWRYRDPGLLLAQRLRASNAATRYTGVGGNVPQTLVNQACLDIQAGRTDIVLIAGAETWRTRTRLRASGAKPQWTSQDESIPMGERVDEDMQMAGPAEIRIKLDRPAYVYPMFEQALRIAAGESADDHLRRIGELWSQFSGVAAKNPHAWSREPLAPHQIWQPRPRNRMISWPYTKLMNSNNMVDQGAALVLTSVAKATYLQIPSDHWVFPYAGTDAHDTYAIGERAEFHRSPAIRIGGQRALQLAGVGVDELDLIDVYSCFPSAVQVAANELGLPLGDPSRPLTVTGGLTFAGGPWNNYVTHSIATMAERLVANPGQRGFITANGGYLTKHSFGVYGTEPPSHEFRWEDVQPDVDREPTRAAVVEWSGVGTVECWTTPFNRTGSAEKAFLSVRTPEDSRVLAVIPDPAEAETTVRDDIAGVKVQVNTDGTATLRD